VWRGAQNGVTLGFEGMKLTRKPGNKSEPNLKRKGLGEEMGGGKERRQPVQETMSEKALVTDSNRKGVEKIHKASRKGTNRDAVGCPGGNFYLKHKRGRKRVKGGRAT